MRAAFPSVLRISLLLFAATAFAQIPRTISYQGILCDVSGNPKPDVVYSFTFRLYETSGGGTALWSEQKNIQTRRGLFNTLLGDAVAFPSSIAFDKPYWLSIQVGAEQELTPRVQFSAAPYSFSAETAGPWQRAGSGVYYQGGNVGIGTKTPSAALDVKDGIVVTGSGVEGGQIVLMNGDNGGNGWVVDNYGTTGSEALRFFKQQSNASINAMSLSSSGNVGIGGATGTDRLEVRGVVKSDSGGFRFPDGSVQTTAAAGTGGDNLGNHTATRNINLNGHWLSGDGSNRGISISTPGGVGIGTGAPNDVGLVIKIGAATLTISPDGDVTINARNIHLNADSTLSLQAANIDIEGSNITSKAKVAVKTESASISSKAAADNIIKGGVVMIN
jgi:hypothetical protein